MVPVCQPTWRTRCKGTATCHQPRLAGRTSTRGSSGTSTCWKKSCWLTWVLFSVNLLYWLVVLVGTVVLADLFSVFSFFLSVSFQLVVAIRAAVFWLLVQSFAVAYVPPNHLGAHSTNNQLSNYMFSKGNSENVKYPQTNTIKSQIKKYQSFVAPL